MARELHDSTGQDLVALATMLGQLRTTERVKLIGGRLDIDPTSHGTTVRVTIPLGGERT